MSEAAGSSLETRPDPLAEGWQAAWAGSGGRFAECCTPDVQYEDPIAVEPLSGPDALEAHAGLLRTALPDLRLERNGPRLGNGPFACIPWRLVGTHRGAAGSLPPTGRFLIVHGVHYLELADGRVRRARGFFDLYDAGVQLGLLPARGSLSETALLLLRGFGLRPRP